MNAIRLCAIASILLCAVSLTVRSSEQSTRLVISEGNYIGYATVADALATLKSQGFMTVPGTDGGVSFVEPDNRTTWTFAGKNDPAYPSAVRYVYTKRNGVTHVEITILCEASDAPCEKFRSDIRDSVSQLSKMMAGDPSVKCRVNNDAMKCGAEPVRKQTGQQIYVQVGDDGSCTVDSAATPCMEIGKKIRAEHPSDDPRVNVCGSEKTTYDAVGKVLSASNEAYLSPAFGCPPH
jgi:biopolymer transport protein ExbD